MLNSAIRRLLATAATIVAAALLATPALAQKTKLTVYSALEADQVGAYKTAFEAANPDIEIAWVRDSTGVITARFLAEKDNPRAVMTPVESRTQAISMSGFAASKAVL